MEKVNPFRSLSSSTGRLDVFCWTIIWISLTFFQKFLIEFFILGKERRDYRNLRDRAVNNLKNLRKKWFFINIMQVYSLDIF